MHFRGPERARMRHFGSVSRRLSRAILALVLAITPALNMVAFNTPAAALAGSYSLKLYAADPATNNGAYLPTYAKVPPSALTYPLSGRQNNPLPNAVLYSAAGTRDGVTSLMPKDTPLGCVIAFELEINVTGSTAPENGIITITPEWLGKTASGGDFGFDVTHGILAAFVDTGDAGTVDPLGNATVSRFSSSTLSPGTNNERIGGEIVVAGLDQGDKVVVEIWVPLDPVFPAKATGNVSTNMTKAYTGDVPGSGASISTGNQTIPLLQVGDYATTTTDLALTKTDGPDPVLVNGVLNYTLVVKNNSTANTASAVVITDTLDAGTTYIPGSLTVSGTTAVVTPSYSNGVLTLPIGALSPLQQVTLTFGARVSGVSPQTATASSAANIHDRTNTATVTLTGTDPVLTNNTATAYTGVVPKPTVTVTKNASPSTLAVIGGTAAFTFTVTNTSPGLQPVSVTSLVDNVFGDISNEVGLPVTLNAGSTFTGSITRFVTPGAGGVHRNTGTFSAQDLAGNLASASASETVTFEAAAPALGLVKNGTWHDHDGDGVASAGDRIDYTFAVSNTGNVPLTGVTVTDALVTVSGGPIASLAVGATDSTTFSATYVLKQADVDAGALKNTATAHGAFGATDIAHEASDTQTLAAAPALMLSKSSDRPSFDASGQKITYSYLITNIGNVTLTGPFTVTDDKLGTVTFTGSTLAPGDQLTATATHTVTQAELDAGPITNIAVAHAVFGGTTVDSDAAERTVDAVQRPSVELTKVANPNMADTDGDFDYDAGEVITYTLTVTNTGNVTLTNLRVTDASGMVSGGPLASLAPGAMDSTTFSAAHLVTQAEYDTGAFTNTARVLADFGGETYFHDDSWTENFDPTAALELSKTGTWVDTNEDGMKSAGDVVDYAFVVTNIAAAPLTNVMVTDPLVTVSGGPIALLAPGAVDSTTFSGSYTLTQSDVDAGVLLNIATAHCFDPDMEQHFHADADVQDFEPVHELALTKHGMLADTNGDGMMSAGDVVTYAFTVKNTGNVTLTNVTVADPKATVEGGPIASLAPGATDSETFTATHALTQADVDAGIFVNTATATGSFGVHQATGEASDTQTLAPAPSLSLAKSSDVATYTAGTKITYTYTLTNIGNVTVAGPFAVADDKLGTIAFEGTALAPGGQLTTTATYTATQADVDAGSIRNVAMASGVLAEQSVDSDSAERTVTAEQAPSITLEKTGTRADTDRDGMASAGDVVTYAFTVKNTGNVTLTGITVTDPKATVSGGTIASLAPGATDSATFGATYTLTQADVDAGSFTNTATATGDFGEEAVSATDDDTQTLAASPGLSLIKHGTWADANGDGHASAGDSISYAFTVKNTGNVTLFGIEVTDALAVMSGGPVPALAPGAVDTTTFTGVHTLTQSEVDSGMLTNTAVVFAGTPTSNPVFGQLGSIEAYGTDTQGLAPAPALALEKSADTTTYDSVGQVITYTYTIKNTGNVTLAGPVSVTDDKVDVVVAQPVDGALSPGESCTGTATHAVTQADLDAGGITNVAQARAGTVRSTSVTLTVDATPDPGITIDETGKNLGGPVLGPGDEIVWTIVVTNTGNVTLKDVGVKNPVPRHTTYVPQSMTGPWADPTAPGVLSWVIPELAPGQSRTLTFRTTLNQGVPTGTRIVSQATAEAEDLFLGYSETVSADSADVSLLQTGANDWLWVVLSTLMFMLGGAAMALGLRRPRVVRSS